MQHQINWPSTQKYKQYVNDNIKNCDITIEGIVRVEDAYGKPEPLLKEKIVKTNTQAAKRMVVNALSMDIKEEHRSATLSMDFLSVNRFLVCSLQVRKY